MVPSIPKAKVKFARGKAKFPLKNDQSLKGILLFL